MGRRANPTLIGAFLVGAVALVVIGILVDETKDGLSQLPEQKTYGRVQHQHLHLLAAGHAQGSHTQGATGRDAVFSRVIRQKEGRHDDQTLTV